MYFCGDVILLDPCNAVSSEEDWQLVLTKKCEVKLDRIGIENYLILETDGEYRFNVINDAGERVGEVCTDTCLFCVLLFKDLLNYYPDFDDYIKLPDSCCIIKDFEGEISGEEIEDGYMIKGIGKNGFHTEECE